MNKAILMGRLVKDPEVRYTTNNVVYTTFTLAVNRRFAGNNEQTADFINVITWNKTAEFCSMYFKKGQQVGVIGRIQTRNYEDKNGNRVYVTEVVGEEAYFAEGKQGTSNTSNSKPDSFGMPSYDEPDQTVDFSSFSDDEFKIETEDDINF